MQSKIFDSLPEHLIHEWSRLHGTNILRKIFFYLKEKTTTLKKDNINQKATVKKKSKIFDSMPRS